MWQTSWFKNEMKQKLRPVKWFKDSLVKSTFCLLNIFLRIFNDSSAIFKNTYRKETQAIDDLLVKCFTGRNSYSKTVLDSWISGQKVIVFPVLVFFRVVWNLKLPSKTAKLLSKMPCKSPGSTATVGTERERERERGRERESS